MRTTKNLRLLTTLVLGGITTSSFGQLLINPVTQLDTGKTEGAIGLGVFKTNYDASFEGAADSEGTIERQYIYVSLAAGFTPAIDLILAGAFTYEAETENFNDNDSGYIIGIGIRAKLYEKNRNSLHAFGQLSHFDEDYGQLNETAELFGTEASADGTELLLGLVYAYTTTDFTLFAGGLLIPYSDGEAKFRVFGTDSSGMRDDTSNLNVERSEIASFILGGHVDLGAVLLQADAILIGEESFRVSVIRHF